MKQKLEVILGDITKVKVDAIVNAANSSLMGGGGVDGAIHRAGGRLILEECKNIVAKQGPCPTGQAVITNAGLLEANFVIHTVGPIWKGGANNEPHLLAECYLNSLELAAKNGCKSLAFPAISTGVYRYPIEEAAKIAVKSVIEVLQKHPGISRVLFVCFDWQNYEAISKELRE